jgi:hypothetical protein
MTIQKINVRFGDKNYDVILEDGVVSYIDPSEPDVTKQLTRGGPDPKVTSIEGAKRIVLQNIRKRFESLMTFSD